MVRMAYSTSGEISFLKIWTMISRSHFHRLHYLLIGLLIDLLIGLLTPYFNGINARGAAVCQGGHGDEDDCSGACSHVAGDE